MLCIPAQLDADLDWRKELSGPSHLSHKNDSVRGCGRPLSSRHDRAITILEYLRLLSGDSLKIESVGVSFGPHLRFWPLPFKTLNLSRTHLVLGGTRLQEREGIVHSSELGQDFSVM